tara:strand:+ start:34 stop:228 length:195 start_codon:yes stop_codon:yes gene_type:complete
MAAVLIVISTELHKSTIPQVLAKNSQKQPILIKKRLKFIKNGQKKRLLRKALYILLALKTMLLL